MRKIGRIIQINDIHNLRRSFVGPYTYVINMVIQYRWIFDIFKTGRMFYLVVFQAKSQHVLLDDVVVICFYESFANLCIFVHEVVVNNIITYSTIT